MIIDRDLQFSDRQSIAATAGNTVVSTDVVQVQQVKNFLDTLVNSRPNVSGKIFFNVVVTTALVAAVNGSAVTVALYNHTTTTPTSGGDVLFTKTVTANTATAQPAGTILFSVGLPTEALKPYFGVLVSVATQNLASGAISAWLGNQIQTGT